MKDAHASARCSIADGEWVIAESRELAARHPTDRGAIAQCALRIEVDWAREDAFEITNLLASIEPAIARAYGPIWVFDASASRFV